VGDNVIDLADYRRRPARRMVAVVEMRFQIADEETAIDAANHVMDVDLRAEYPRDRRKQLLWAMLHFFGGGNFSTLGFKQVGVNVRVVEEDVPEPARS
jgi:hypothetical protein